MKTKILQLLCLLLAVNFIYAQGGKIDSTFGTNGFTRVSPEGFYSGSISNCRAIAITTTGKVLMGGYGYNGNSGIEYQAMSQLRKNGTVDPNFGASGIQNYQPVSGPNYFSGIRSVVEQPDGKFIVAVANFVYTNSNIDSDEIVVTRFNADGTLDGKFGTAGSVYLMTHSQSDDQNPQLALQADGKILVGSTNLIDNFDYTIKLWRLTDAGLPDYSFNSTGYIDFKDRTPAWSMQLSKILVQGTNIVVAGTQEASPGAKNSFMLIRILENGFVDYSFGSSPLGTEIKNFGAGTSCICYTAALQKDGSIIMSGTTTPKNEAEHCTIASFTKNGKLNKNFNGTGSLLLSQSLYAYPNALAIQKDGKIVAAGLQYTYGAYNHGIVLRINTNGHLDSSFATNGIITPDSTLIKNFSSVAIDNNDNIVACGYSIYAGFGVFGAARYLSNLSLNMTSDAIAINKNTAVDNHVAAPLIYPNPVQKTATLTYTLDADEKVSISLYDISGRLVQTFQTSIQKNKGTYKEQLNFQPSLPAGNYMLIISTQTKKASIKILKQ